MQGPWILLALAGLVAAGGCGTPRGGEAGAKMAGQKAELTLAERIEGRTYPSVFQAWNPADNLKDEDPLVTIARHDLFFLSPGQFGLGWNSEYAGLATEFAPDGLAQANEKRRKLLELNPRMVLIAEIRYRDAGDWYLPSGHPWWKRDEKGEIVAGWEEGGYFQLDFANPEYRERVAAQARAAVESGIFDGVMLDWWKDDEDRIELVRAVREAVGPDALILANANANPTPLTAPYINGYFMECTSTQGKWDWDRIAETLRFAEANLREPRINCLETWYHESRRDLNLMRATTTLALTMSDGYALFSDPNPLPAPDHLHDWYPFWDEPLGRPKGKGVKRTDGAWERDFSGGTAVYNPYGNGIVHVSFKKMRRSAATGATGREFELNSPDGDLYLPP